MANLYQPSMGAAFTSHAALEAQVSNFFSSLSLWAEDKGFFGSASYFKMLAKKHRHHMSKFLNYVNDMYDAVPAVPDAPKASSTPASFVDSWVAVSSMESQITEAINKLSVEAGSSGDQIADRWLEKFLGRQLDTYRELKRLLRLVKKAGEDTEAQMEIDHHISEKGLRWG